MSQSLCQYHNRFVFMQPHKAQMKKKGSFALIFDQSVPGILTHTTADKPCSEVLHRENLTRLGGKACVVTRIFQRKKCDPWF